MSNVVLEPKMLSGLVAVPPSKVPPIEPLSVRHWLRE